MKNRTVIVRPISRHTTEFEGPGVYDVIKDLNIPKMRPTHGARTWWVPQHHTHDIIAALEHRKFNITLITQ